MRALRRILLALGSTTTLADLTDHLAAIHGDRPLVLEPDRPPRTARQVGDVVARWSGGLADAVEPGGRVVVALPNSYDVLLAVLAVSRAGGVAVPVSTTAPAAELDHVVADSGATVVLRSAADIPTGVPRPPATPDPAGTAAIFYTSGTTGRPKGAELTHRGLLQSVRAAVLWPHRLRRDEAVVGLPVAHIMGFAVLLGLGAAGVPVRFLPRFRADEVLDVIERHRPTIFVGVPAMYRLLLEAGAEDRDLRSIRLWASGADVMPDDLARRFQRMGATVTLPFVKASLGEAAFAEGYGMVELAGGVAARIRPPLVPFPLGGGLGFPLPPNRLRVVDEDQRRVPAGAVGELQVKGPGVLRGYHGDAAATTQTITADGWLRTGDLARRGPLGAVLFEGRATDRIKSGGYSVFAGEIERALEEHPDVAEAAAVGLDDGRLGQVAVAAVRLHRRAAVTAGDLEQWAASRLATYKRPRRVVVVDSLPRTATEKVRRQSLRRLFD